MGDVYRHEVREPLSEEVERYEKVCKANPRYDMCPECDEHALKLFKRIVVNGENSGFIFKCSNCGYEEEGGF
jgi:uncharacterized protein with PIN domain